MELTHFTDYALRLLINLAQQQERLVTINEVAGHYDLSESHMMKVVAHLAQKGYLETIRGKNGGIRLSRRPELINIGDVVRDTEHFQMVDCFDSGKQSCPLLPRCLLRVAITQATRSFLGALDKFTLADLTPRRPPHVIY